MERSERQRQKEARKAEKLKQQQERTAQRKADGFKDGDPPPDESGEGIA